MIVELVNALACAVLMVGLFSVAVLVARWHHKLAVIVLSCVLGMQVIDPIARWLPSVSWSTGVANVTLALLAVLWRRELWALVRFKLGHAPRPGMRRPADFEQSYGGTSIE